MKGTKSSRVMPKVPLKIKEERTKKIINEFLAKNKSCRNRVLVNTNLDNI
jgi:hypothetical protein